MGHTVTVEADVDEVLTPYAFELDEDSPVAGGVDNDLIVAVSEEPQPGAARQQVAQQQGARDGDRSQNERRRARARARVGPRHARSK